MSAASAFACSGESFLPAEQPQQSASLKVAICDAFVMEGTAAVDWGLRLEVLEDRDRPRQTERDADRGRQKET